MTQPPQVPRSAHAAPRHPSGARRRDAFAVRGDLGGAVPHPGLSLRHDGGGGGALQRRRAGLHLFALRQSDGRDVRAAHGAVRGRRGGARHRQRHGGGHRGADGPAQGRRPCRRVAGAVRLVSLCRRGAAAAFRRRLDAGRGNRPRRLAAAMRPNTKTAFLESPTNPTLEVVDIAAVADDPPRGRRDAGGRQRLRFADAAASAGARRRLRRLFRDQAHRRPGPHARRRHPRLRGVHRRRTSTISCARPAPACRRSTPGCC